jgi:hypothetical protein
MARQRKEVKYMKNNEKNEIEECTCGHMHKKGMWVIGLVVLLLLIGEVMIYKNQIKLNKMMSEGLMQVKENTRFERGVGRMQPNIILQDGQVTTVPSQEVVPATQ